MILGRIRAFFGSMAGHIFLLLTIGMSVAAIISLLVAERARDRDFARIRMERVVASVTDIAERLRQNPVETQTMLEKRRIWGAYIAPPGIALTSQDPVIEDMIRNRLGHKAMPEAGEVPVGFCFPIRKFDPSRRAAGIIDAPLPDCWIVRFTDMEGTRRALAIDLPRLAVPPSSTLDPIYLLLIFGSSATLSILVARLTATPLRRLERAAQSFSVSLMDLPRQRVTSDLTTTSSSNARGNAASTFSAYSTPPQPRWVTSSRISWPENMVRPAER